MEIQLLRKWIILSSIYHLNMISLGYNTGLHQYTPITSYQGIKCGGDFESAETLEKAMQACDRLEKCTSISTDLNWHRAFPIADRDYDNGCGMAGHHYMETFHLCQGPKNLNCARMVQFKFCIVICKLASAFSALI